MQRSTSKGSQTDLPVESSAVLDEIVEETFENAARPAPPIPDDAVQTSDLEIERARLLESRPNSPGVDPRQAMPISGEDVVDMEEPLVDGLGSHDGPPHKAITVHLPPKEVQEQHLRNVQKAHQKKEQLSINLPPRDDGRPAEPLSSPGSTIGAHSATTPALHETSTDTSPDNEARYDADRLDDDEDRGTPIELKKTSEEEAEDARHERIHKAQMEIAQAKILETTSITDEEGIDVERQEKATAMNLSQVEEQLEVNDSQAEEDADALQVEVGQETLTKEANEVVQDVEDDRTEIENASQDVSMAGVHDSSSHAQTPVVVKGEIADSDAEDQSPLVDAMDVDVPTVKDSFEISATTTDVRGDITHMSPNSLVPVIKTSQDSRNSPATPVTSTPKRTPPISTPAPQTMERMTTRVSSGAMRHKSVSEILGEIPRPNTTSGSERSQARGDSDSARTSNSPSRSTTPQSPGTRMRSLVERARDKERSKLSTVVFAKQSARPTSNENTMVQSGLQASKDAKNDYFLPLFLATSSTSSRGVPSLDNLLATAHKTISTSNAYVPINENQTAKVLKRIYNLQSAGKWSLRQPKRSEEPQRQTTHWDVLLQETKWMRTDFREERKWKMTVARNLAFACAEWYEAGPEDRKLLQVKAAPTSLNESKDIEMGDVSNQLTHTTPDLVASGELDSPSDEFDEEPGLNLLETVAPTDIFGLQDDDVVFGLRRSPTTDKLLEELPMYGAPLSVPSSEPSKPDLDPDRYWRREALPLSKYVEGRMELKPANPPRKKSRFEYEDESDEDDEVVFGEQRKNHNVLPPDSTDVALFNPEHKHIRDRIHAGHQFRPPSEYPMPLQSFFECRMPSQWTYAEDDALKTHVRDYSYNWSLISNLLTSPSLFSSGAERRTPWECFERWICLEGLPADMQKTHYFRAYNSRVEAANRNVLAQAAQQPQQANAQGQLQQPRRRTTASIRVDRRRQQKYLSMVDAMRKLAKKKETTLTKAAHAANLAAMRKANEVPQQRNILRTPQEFSKLKFEQTERMKQQYEALVAQRQQNNARALMQARLQQSQNAQQPGLPNGTPQQRPVPTNAPLQNGTPSGGQNLTVPGQNRARGPLPAQMAGQVPMQNNLRVPQPMMNGVPQAQMQGMQGQLPLPNPALDVGLVTQAHRISEQQRQAIQMRQQGQIPGPGQVQNSPPRNMNGMSPPNFPMPNGNMMAFPNVNGVSSPGGGPNQGQAGSPRLSHPQQLANPMLPQAQRIEEQLRQKYPNASTDQIMRMVTEHITKSMHQRQGIAQSAMNAAAGGNMGMVNGMGMNGMSNGRIPSGVENSPQMYAQMLRQQQENQQKAQAQAAANAASNGQNGQSGQGHQRSGSSTSGN